ncbi:MAG: polysaccharide biosynthesis/export family protein [Chthoniobacterales bacterium]
MSIESHARKFLKVAGLLPLALVVFGCTTPPQQPAEQTMVPTIAQRPLNSPDDPREATLRLRHGDTMEVRLGGVPPEEITQVTGTYVVDTQGFVNIPHLGRVMASGLTQEQLQTAIENGYRAKGIYTDPTITVSVPMQARFVNVGGEVRMPQRVAYTPDLTAMSAISAAGGLTEYASQSRIRLVRDGKVIKVNMRKVRENPELDIPLEPGDSIEVMRSFF